MSKKVKIALWIVIVVVAGFLAWWKLQKTKLLPDYPKPQSTAESRFYNAGTDYSCSRPVDGEWKVGSRTDMTGQSRQQYYFHPSNQQDVKKYCRESIVIEEYRAVLDILRRKDVNQIIEKYNAAEAWVKALGHKYIKDKEYLARILPEYSSIKIDCIIVVHSPESTRFFIENGEVHESHDDHQYLEVPAAEFLASLNHASDEDVINFWLGLR